jgi:superfamily II DNA/RNA helicase
MNFKQLGLHDQVIEAISYMGFETATPIQEQAIPKIMEGRDLIACAQTGTGKTAAFILPILDELSNDHKPETSSLVICPTRELALQIEQQIQGFAYFIPVNSAAVYGGGDGDDWEQQKKALTSGTDIIVATPGKLISHLNMGYVKFETVKHLILDEADRMLDMGFREDIDKIISFLPKKRQTLMFSATMPQKIRELASKTMNQPFEINIALAKPPEGVLQGAYLVYDNQKIALVKGLIKDKPNYKSILIFSSTKRKVSEIVNSLRTNSYEVKGISSDFEQKEREAVLSRFKSKKTRVLVATDVLSRGIDIKDINLIINFDVPNNAEDYVHRVGRTARAETTGVAITLINESDMLKFSDIEKLIEKEVMKLRLPTDLGTGPDWNPKSEKGRKSFRAGRHKGRRNNKSRKK